MAIPKITEEDIRNHVGSQSFERGYEYFNDGNISNAVSQGNSIKAYCEGSQDLPYWVKINFNGKAIESDCTCPIGSECKHAAALLLTWMNKPEEFKQLENFNKIMEKLSKEELIGFFKQVMERHPELEQMLETTAPKTNKKTKVDMAAYQRQAASAFNVISRSYSWGVEEDIASRLEIMVENGNKFVKQDDCANAAAVYQAVSEEILENYEMVRDDDGYLGSVVNKCVEGFGKCLALSKDDSLRKQILEALFSVYKFDMDFGGVGLSDDVPDIILKHATPEEQKIVAEWVKKKIPSGSGGDRTSWHLQEYGGFLLDLEKKNMDSETFLQICRQTGRLDDLVDRLLTLKRLDEAVQEAKKAGDYQLLSLADVFVKHRHSKTAQQLMEERADDNRILDWLKNFYSKKGDNVLALDVARKLFDAGGNWSGRSLSGYKDIKSLAEKLGTWEKVQEELISDLITKKDYDLLTKIYLEEGLVEKAIESVKKAKTAVWDSNSLQEDVAKAAEKTNPKASIDIYHKLAEDLINQKGRHNYSQACSYLFRMQRLYKKIGELPKWEKFISDLKEKHHNWPALLEELAERELLPRGSVKYRKKKATESWDLW